MKGLLVLGMCMMNGISSSGNIASSSDATVVVTGEVAGTDAVATHCPSSTHVGTDARTDDALNYDVNGSSATAVGR